MSGTRVKAAPIPWVSRPKPSDWPSRAGESPAPGMTVPNFARGLALNEFFDAQLLGVTRRR
ncbi:MAG: hypothetical protein EPN51_10670 [Mycobacterium sp.]|nr:MAG: hypothetical protein EPN51_10670 [Mycobacterium sp.]